MPSHPEILLHIGVHKTATTYFQMDVFPRADLGFCRLWNTPAQRMWARRQFIMNHEAEFDAAAVRAAVAQDAAAHDPALMQVFSDERLSGQMMSDWRSAHHVAGRLHAVFPTAKVLIGIREQNAMLASSYMQYLRLNGEWGIEQFIRREDDPRDFTPILPMARLKYDRMIAQYQTLFGPEQVFVMPFERLIRDRAGMLSDLGAFLGGRDLSQAPAEKRNASVGPAGMSFLRHANRYIKRSPEEIDRPGRPPWSYRQKMRAAWKIGAWVPKARQDAIKARQKAYIAQEVGSYFASSNRALQELTGLDLAQYGYKI